MQCDVLPFLRTVGGSFTASSYLFASCTVTGSQMNYSRLVLHSYIYKYIYCMSSVYMSNAMVNILNHRGSKSRGVCKKGNTSRDAVQGENSNKKRHVTGHEHQFPLMFSPNHNGQVKVQAQAKQPLPARLGPPTCKLKGSGPAKSCWWHGGFRGRTSAWRHVLIDERGTFCREVWEAWCRLRTMWRYEGCLDEIFVGDNCQMLRNKFKRTSIGEAAGRFYMLQKDSMCLI